MQKLSRKNRFKPIFSLRHKSKAFTLIELLITMALMSILASALLIAINPLKRSQQARDAIRKSDISAIQNALEVYYAENNGYPNRWSGWLAN